MQDPHPHELVIIRRRPDPEADEPKGGVWKIAYADFMTAMMAFFLVMWLINATDQDTREVVASYFNPIRLAEATTDRKGLRDPDESSLGVDLEERSDAPVTEAEEQVVTAPRRVEDERRYSETALFQDPYAVLAELAAQAAFQPATPAAGIDLRPGDRGEPGLDGGDAYRDPFDPIYWQLAPQVAVGRSDGDGTGGPIGAPDAAAPFGLGGPAGPTGIASADLLLAERALSEPRTPPVDGAIALDGEPRAVAGSAPGDGAGEIAPGSETPTVETHAAETGPEGSQDPDAESVARAETPPPARTADREEEPVFPARGQASDADRAPEAAEVAQAEASDVETLDHAESAQAAEAAEPDPALARVAALRTRIAAAMARAAGTPLAANTPEIEVAATPEGVLVSLTDAADFGMFAIGSAEPRPELVRVLEEIAPILAEAAGTIVIRGHTDARPFRSAEYDNWRLSSARAHMAYYMLVRGGFAEDRILRVEGHADRLLKRADDPLAAQNRRIEILLSAAEGRS